jgi:plasmid stabilization system protein ParE
VKHPVFFRAEAEADIEAAALWYEKQCSGLGNQFLTEILHMCNSIADNPNSFPVIHRKTHRALIKRFPFGIYYRIADEAIVVIAVMHGSRHPRRWQRRSQQ